MAASLSDTPINTLSKWGTTDIVFSWVPLIHLGNQFILFWETVNYSVNFGNLIALANNADLIAPAGRP